MDETGLLSHIGELERKVGALTTAYALLREELVEVRSQNQSLRHTVSQQQQQLDEWQNRSKLDQLVEQLAAGTDDASALMAKIDEYIVELDHCIAFLNKQL
jgi:FtsZ-binding cell division protein ZapB